MSSISAFDSRRDSFSFRSLNFTTILPTYDNFDPLRLSSQTPAEGFYCYANFNKDFLMAMKK